jgi:CheY-like chemotaxis protein
MNPLLLAEDEPVSRAFLVDALLTLDLRCDAVDDGALALRQARGQRYALLLLDVNLPSLRGDALLRALRADTTAASNATPALALTADDDPALWARLRADGFAGVARKPLSIEALAAAVAPFLDAVALAPPLPRWSDTDALAAAGGHRDIVVALRRLMLQELPAQRDAVAAALARGDAAAANGVLHKLQAACGFCGARALAAAAAQLHRRGDGETLRRFVAEADALLADAR